MAEAVYDINEIKRRMQGAIEKVLCGKGHFTTVG